MDSKKHIALTESYSAHNYHPLPVVIERAEGVWMYDVEGKKYLDFLASYSALNWGHCNKRFTDVVKKQIDKLHLTGRAVFNDKLGEFSKELSELCKLDVVLPMNTGAEAVETAIKASRRWGYEKKGVESAEIIVFDRNFGGRTTTIVSFATPGEATNNFGPFTPGFKVVPFGDIEAVRSAITKNTVAVIVEPIQGEGGINVPPQGFLRGLRELCTSENVLFVADEVQTGFCRTGEVFACEHEDAIPDLYILGKALGAGIMPVSALVGRSDVMDVFRPGSHGSTYGGNPLACAIGLEVIRYIKEEKPQVRAQQLGEWFISELKAMNLRKVKEIRGRGLMIGIEIDPSFGDAYSYCIELAKRGVITKDTRKSTMRVAPPLIIEKSELSFGLNLIKEVLR
jgi:ornithine--oxo-acid transaminase